MTSLLRSLPALVGAGRRARWRRTVLRRLLAAGCAAAAVVVLVDALRPAPPATVAVVVAAAPVPAGSVLGLADVRTTRVPEGSVQPGALRATSDAVGRRTTSPLTAGEWITRTRLVPRGPADGLTPGRVALHVGLADPLTADVVGAGQRVLVFATTGGSALARQAVVLSADPPPDEPVPGLGPQGGRGLVLSLPAEEAERVLAGHGGLEGPVVVNVVAAAGP